MFCRCVTVLDKMSLIFSKAMMIGRMNFTCCLMSSFRFSSRMMTTNVQPKLYDRILSVPSNHQVIIQRFLAKNRDRKKEKKTDRPRVMLNDEEMEQVIQFDDLKNEIENLIDEFKEDLKLNYNIKLNPRVIESLEINYDGIKVKLGEIVNIVRKQNDLVINLSATPNAVKATLAAINESGLNLNPQPDGHVIYVKMPKVTTEHRQALAKSVKLAGQKLKDRIKDRNMHKKFYSKDLKKLSQDLVNDAQANLQYHVKQKCSEIDTIVKQKEDSLLSN